MTEIDVGELARILTNPTVRAICDGVDGLPAVPRIYLDLSRAAADPHSSLGDLGRVIASDPAISATVLQLVNSAFFGVMRRMVSIQQAVGYLGVDLLKALVLSAHLERSATTSPLRGISITEFQKTALRVARLAHAFAPRDVAESAFTAGLLLDVGQLVLAQKHPRAFEQCLAAARSTNKPLHEIEAATLNITHAEVGAFLLAQWGLPSVLVECVAFHHRPSWAVDGPLAVRAVVHAADLLVHGREDQLDVALIHRAGYLDHLDRWRAAALEAA